MSNVKDLISICPFTEVPDLTPSLFVSSRCFFFFFRTFFLVGVFSGVSDSPGVGDCGGESTEDCDGDCGESCSLVRLALPGKGFFFTFFSGVARSDIDVSLQISIIAVIPQDIKRMLGFFINCPLYEDH